MANLRVTHDTDSDAWLVCREDETEPMSSHGDQGEAIDAGRRVAQQEQVNLIIEADDGMVVDELRYRPEPGG